MKNIHTKKMMQLYMDADRLETMAANTSKRFEHDKEAYSRKAKELFSELAKEAEPLTAAIKAAEGRSTMRTITYTDALYYLDKVFNAIGIPKKAMEGVAVHIDIHAQKFPGAYKYRAESTQFSAVYKRGEWIITDVMRNYCLTSANRAVTVQHTDASKAAIIDRLTCMSI